MNKDLHYDFDFCDLKFKCVLSTDGGEAHMVSICLDDIDLLDLQCLGIIKIDRKLFTKMMKKGMTIILKQEIEDKSKNRKKK